MITSRTADGSLVALLLDLPLGLAWFVHSGFAAGGYGVADTKSTHDSALSP